MDLKADQCKKLALNLLSVIEHLHNKEITFSPEKSEKYETRIRDYSTYEKENRDTSNKSPLFREHKKLQESIDSFNDRGPLISPFTKEGPSILPSKGQQQPPSFATHMKDLAKTFDRPSSIRATMFQLSESLSLERIAFILEGLFYSLVSGYQESENSNTPSKDIIALVNKYDLTKKLSKVLFQYCNGDYGFDTEIANLGIFQFSLLKCIIITGRDPLHFAELIKRNTVEYIGQIMEEAIIFAYDQEIRGDMNWNSKLYEFLEHGLSFVELLMSKSFESSFPLVRSITRNLLTRIRQFLNPNAEEKQQEKNCKSLNRTIEKLFGYENRPTNKQEKFSSEEAEARDDSQHMLEDFSDIKIIAPRLWDFSIKVKHTLDKVEALLEVNEDHYTKFDRIFKIIAQEKQKSQYASHKAGVFEDVPETVPVKKTVQFKEERDNSVDKENRIMSTNHVYNKYAPEKEARVERETRVTSSSKWNR